MNKENGTIIRIERATVEEKEEITEEKETAEKVAEEEDKVGEELSYKEMEERLEKKLNENMKGFIELIEELEREREIQKSYILEIE